MQITKLENGYLIEIRSKHSHCVGKSYVAETAERLATLIAELAPLLEK